MKDKPFEALLYLFNVYEISDEQMEDLITMMNEESKKRGFKDWNDAFKNIM